MNEMYKYLQEHSYISENKKSKYQSELSEQRAECIANKYNSLVQDLEQENQKYKEVIEKAKNEKSILKDMVYKPETREENFVIQRKISSLIKRLNDKKVK